MSRIVAILALLTACQNKPAPPPPPLVDPEPVLQAQCSKFAANAAIPWALAHGVVGLGASFKASDGRLAVDAMIDDSVQVQRADGRLHYTFPTDSGGVPVDPHPNLLVKTALIAGVPLSTEFHARSGDAVTLAQLVASIESQFHLEAGSDTYWSQIGWTLDAIGSQRTPDDAKFTNGRGETVDWNQVVSSGFDALERLDGFFETAMAEKKPFVDKRKQGIYQHTCGGFHLIQPVLLWLRFPAVRPALQARFDRQKRILFYRLGSESLVYERARKQNPGYRLLVLVQELKFYGHWLETIGRLQQAGAYVPSDDEAKQIARAREDLTSAVNDLRDEKAFERMPEIEKSGFQTYLDLIGDACHALNGWRLTSSH